MYVSQTGEMDYSNECPLAINKNTCGDCPYGDRIRTNEYICHLNDSDEEEYDGPEGPYDI